MKEEIIKIIENLSVQFWENCSKTETPKMSKEEIDFVNYQNDKAAEQIIKLKNK